MAVEKKLGDLLKDAAYNKGVDIKDLTPDEVKDIAVKYVNGDINKITSVMGTYNAMNLTTNQKNAILKSMVDERTSALVTDLEGKLDAANKEIAEKDSEIERLKQSGADATMLNTLKSELELIRSDLNLAKAEAENLRVQFETKKKEYESLKLQKEAAEGKAKAEAENAEKVKAELDEYKKANPTDTSSAKIEALNAQLAKANANFEALSKNAASLKLQLSEKEENFSKTAENMRIAYERAIEKADVAAEKKYLEKITKLQNEGQKKDEIITKYKGKSKRRGVATAILSGALALSIGGGIINGIIDENQITDLEAKIKGLNEANATYVTEIEGLNASLNDINELYAQSQKENEELKKGNSDLDAYTMNADELIVAFKPLVDSGILTQDQVDSFKNEDGTIDLSILVNVDETGYLYSLAMDKIDNEKFKKALDEKLNETLDIVDAKVEDEDGNEVDATLAYFTDENGYVDSTGIISEINESLNEYRNNLQTAYETLSSMTSDGTITLPEGTLESIMSIRDVTEAIVDTAEDAVSAYNSVVEDNNDLTTQLEDSEAIKESMQTEIDEKDQIIADKDKVIAEKDKIIAEKDQQIEGLENSINNGIESGTTGDSAETESGDIPATPSGDNEENKEDNKNPNQVGQGSSNENQGGVELGG